MEPSRTVQARTSFSPAVKKVTNPRVRNAFCISLSSPECLTPSASRYFFWSSSESEASSASVLAEITTTCSSFIPSSRAYFCAIDSDCAKSFSSVFQTTSTGFLLKSGRFGSTAPFLSLCFSTISRSANSSSVLTVSKSLLGSTLPPLIMFSSVKALTT